MVKNNWYFKHKQNPIWLKKYRARKNKWVKAHKEYYAALKRKINLNPIYKMKRRAQQLLRYHVRQGNIKKGIKCEFCNSKIKIEAHHDDYSEPLQVLWLCQLCHIKRHKKFEPKVPKFVKSKFNPTK